MNKKLAELIIEGAKERIAYNTKLKNDPPKLTRKEWFIKHIKEDQEIIKKYSKEVR